MQPAIALLFQVKHNARQNKMPFPEVIQTLGVATATLMST